MRVRNVVEVLYLSLMKGWQTNAPPDGHYGLLDSKREQNSQEARLAYILVKIAAGQIERAFSTLSQHTQRRDGGSYISTDTSRMTSPYPLWGGWHLEGCVSLEQKRGIIRQLRHLGLSPGMIEAIDAFVSGEDFDKYFPTEEEEQEMIRQAEMREEAERQVSR